MKIYQTNAALGYNQLAFLIRLEKSKNGYDYLCIGTQNVSNDDTYYFGKIVKDLEDFYINETKHKPNDLFNRYLFSKKDLKEAFEIGIIAGRFDDINFNEWFSDKYEK